MFLILQGFVSFYPLWFFLQTSLWCERLTSLNLCTSSSAYHSPPSLSQSQITIQYHFPASAAQRPVSGALVTEYYQLAQMKWPLEKTSQNISPSLSPSLPLSLSASLFRTTSLSIWFSPSLSVGSRVWKACQGSIDLHHQHFARHVLLWCGVKW